MLITSAGGGAGAAKNQDTIFTENYLNAPQITGAFDAVKLIVASLTAENVFIVSKAG